MVQLPSAKINVENEHRRKKNSHALSPPCLFRTTGGPIPQAHGFQGSLLMLHPPDKRTRPISY